MRRPGGRPRQTWLRTISDDLKHLSLNLHSAYRQAKWQKIVETAVLTSPDDDDDDDDDGGALE